MPWSLLASVTTPEFPTLPNVEYGYDALGRIDQVMDAVAIQQGTRGPYNFFLADGTRGERDDPLGQPYTVVYDTYGHPSRFIDEVPASLPVSALLLRTLPRAKRPSVSAGQNPFPRLQESRFQRLFRTPQETGSKTLNSGG